MKEDFSRQVGSVEGPHVEEYTQEEIKDMKLTRSLELKGYENPEVFQMVCVREDELHDEAEQKIAGNPSSTMIANRANIEAQIKMARIYYRTVRYREHGLNELTNAIHAAIQDPSTYDLIAEIQDIIGEPPQYLM